MLTAKQEQFVQGIIQGLSQADAYRAAYSTKNMSDKTIHEKASRLMSTDKVGARVAELREQISSKSIMTAQERLEFLTEVINGTRGEKVIEVIDGESKEIEVPASMKNRLSAVDIMNKMQGVYTTKIEGEIKVKRLEDLI